MLATGSRLTLPPFPERGKELEGVVLYAPLYDRRLSGSPFRSVDNNHHTCTVTGAVLDNDGRLFAGGDDGINVAQTGLLDITGIITVEAWAKFAAGAGTKGIAIKTDTASPFYAYGLRITSSLWVMSIQIGGVIYNAGSNSAPTADKWVHLAGVYDDSNVHLYRDTVLQNEQPAISGAINVGDDVFSIGSWRNGGDFFNGTIGEVRVYNRALSQAEITYNYNQTKGRYL